MLKKKPTILSIIFTVTAILLMINNHLNILPEISPTEENTLPEVSTLLEPQFNRLINILESEGIEVDWSNIDKIIMAPLDKRLHGLYIPSAKTIIVTTWFEIPDNYGPRKDLLEVYNDFLLIVLAHEIMHAQMISHTPDKSSIMYPSSTYMLKWLKEIGPEEYILRTYRCMDELKRDYPFFFFPKLIRSNNDPVSAG